MRHLLPSSFCLFALACGGPQDAPVGEVSADEELSTELGDSEGGVTALPSITFHQGWTRAITGNLVQGGQVRVRYEAGRLPECRGDVNGGPAWSITLFSRLAGGAVGSRTIAGQAPDASAPASGEVVLDLPSAGELELWFQATNRWGCSAWDSDFGRNFRFPVARPATGTIRFAADFSERVTGRLRAGSAVDVEYDLSRLPNCRQGYSGLPTWDILAYYRFDGGPAQYVPVTGVINGNQRVSVPTPIAIPTGARRMELWFFASDRGGCRQYDSDFGANYSFTL